MRLMRVGMQNLSEINERGVQTSYQAAKHDAQSAFYRSIGITAAGRHLFVCFTIRSSGLRVISARDMSRQERKLYAELCEK